VLKLSRKVDECKPLSRGPAGAGVAAAVASADTLQLVPFLVEACVRPPERVAAAAATFLRIAPRRCRTL